MAPAESVLKQVQRTCKELVERQSSVHIHQDALSEHLSGASREAILACCKAFRYPCKFDNVEDEVTFMAIRWLLDFGSGYNDLLQVKLGKAARDIVQMGVVGMHITSTPMDTNGLKEFHQQTIMTIFGIDSHQDEDSGIPGVTMSRPGPLAPWTKRLRDTLVTVGEVLEEEGHASLGAFIISFLKDLKAAGKPPSAARLVAELAESIPGFADKGLVDSKSVVFARKAQLLAVDLYLRFKEGDKLFDFQDVSELTADSSAASAALLRHWGVLEYSEELAKLIDTGSPLPTGAQERTLRAACVQAVSDPAAELQPWQISRWMLSLIDNGLVKGLQPHLTKDVDAY